MDDLELQRLKTVAEVTRTVRETANITALRWHDSVDRSDYIVEMDVSARAWEALVDALDVLDMGNEP